jgi:hypothetical protein
VKRRAAVLMVGAVAPGQALFLFGFEPLRRAVTGLPAGQSPLHLHVLGVDVVGFVVQDTSHVGGWLPQAVFVALCAVLTYAVLRALPGARLGAGTVCALLGALLLTAGAVDMLGQVSGLKPHEARLFYPERMGPDRPLDGMSGQPEQFALFVAWLPVLVVAEVRLLQRWPALHGLFGDPNAAPPAGAPAGPDGPDAPDSSDAPVPAPPRRRRDVVAAGLLPAVLLALVGGLVLRHTNVRLLTQHGTVTFDPDLWRPYQPPDLVRDWSGLLYPALRLKPLPTEMRAGWLATCAVCVVFLALLAGALYVLAGRAGGRGAWRVLADCWFATLLAAVAAAVVESALLQHGQLAPRPDPLEDGHTLTWTVGDAVRFGTCWGWAVGVAFLAALRMPSRRQASPGGEILQEGRLSHAE